jgi:hypothetical protein
MRVLAREVRVRHTRKGDPTTVMIDAQTEPARPFKRLAAGAARRAEPSGRSYEQTALGAQTWLEVACVAYLCGRLRIEPT